MRRIAGGLCVFAFLTACAASPQKLQQSAAGLSDNGLCQTYLNDSTIGHQTGDTSAETKRLETGLIDEMIKRDLDRGECTVLLSKSNPVVSNSVSGGAFVRASMTTSDQTGPNNAVYGPSYAWDRFANQLGEPTWRCRNLQTSQVVAFRHCDGLTQADSTWVDN